MLHKKQGRLGVGTESRPGCANKVAYTPIRVQQPVASCQVAQGENLQWPPLLNQT